MVALYGKNWTDKMRWKYFRVAALVGAGVLALLLLVLRPLPSHKLSVKAYFTNASGLRAGAQVRLAGVDIGHVKSVRARPELKDAPVEVVMVLNPPYEVNIPNDSVVSLETAGVLGETYAEIDAARASGPPIGANAVLKVQPTTQLSPEEFLDRLSKAMGRKSCDCSGDKKDDPAKPSEISAHSPTSH